MADDRFARPDERIEPAARPRERAAMRTCDTEAAFEQNIKSDHGFRSGDPHLAASGSPVASRRASSRASCRPPTRPSSWAS